jgi:selenide,water dikinase
MSEEIKLTQFSHGAGCGCKIAPSVLEKILAPSNSPKGGEIGRVNTPLRGAGGLLVGYNTKDDAAVYDIGNGRAIISTTDFFMPIVDDAFDFGRIASANAISDVYAMGGKPLMAIAILGWPVNKIPAELARKVLEGARAMCAGANIPLAGGHSIDSPEPIFGLAVTGEVEITNIKKNSTAAEGCKLFLTKPLGVGMITTASKRGLAQKADFDEAVKSMTQLNSIGYEFGKLDYVKAMTDVTGFGLLGHLVEMCEGSNLSAEIEFGKIPKMKNLSFYINQKCSPGGTERNWKSFEQKISLAGISNPDQQTEVIFTLCDPQTSGGLLAAVDPDYENDFLSITKKHGFDVQSFGMFRSNAGVYDSSVVIIL